MTDHITAEQARAAAAWAPLDKRGILDRYIAQSEQRIAELEAYARKYMDQMWCDHVTEHCANGCAAPHNKRPCESCREWAELQKLLGEEAWP